MAHSFIQKVAFFVELATPFNELPLLSRNKLSLLCQLASLLGEHFALLVEQKLLCVDVFSMFSGERSFVFELCCLASELSLLVFDLSPLSREERSVIIELGALGSEMFELRAELIEFGFVLDHLRTLRFEFSAAIGDLTRLCIESCGFAFELRLAHSQRTLIGRHDRLG